jgi:hypothetical protein
MELDQLIAEREGVKASLAVHKASVWAFWSEGRPGFVIDMAEFKGTARCTGLG